MTDKPKPHISNPIDEARRRINNANHHVYRAGYQDTAYELKRALDKLNESIRLIEQMQKDYPFADPSTIDTSIEAWDPRLAPPPLDDDWDESDDQMGPKFVGRKDEDDDS